MDLVPTIDISRPDATRLAALDAACSDHGFFLLEGHGLDAVIEETWAETRRFFAAPAPVKDSVRRTADQALGYYDRELTKRRRDRKEVFDFMQPDGAIGEKRNRWPSDLDGFRSVQTAFFDAFSDLAVRTLDLVYTALGASDQSAALLRGSPLTSTVRLNHYPVGDPLPEAEREGLPELADVSLGHHTDPGVLTLLLQDDTGGLQALARDGSWIDVPPRAGTIVVNLADSLQVLSNDRYRAAVHRVLPMTNAARYSIPYFYNPPIDAVIEPIEQLCATGPCYRPFTWREFIQARIDDNYADLGAEDTQASHFRITPESPAGHA
jgi:isopenicillin N synthase-like dioxygenase